MSLLQSEIAKNAFRKRKKVAISREIKKRNGAIVSAMQGKIRSIGWVVVEELNLVFELTEKRYRVQVTEIQPFD